LRPVSNVSVKRHINKGSMQKIIKNVQIHVPFRLLTTEHFNFVIKERINPEISFNCTDLDTWTKSVFLEVAKRIAEAGLTVTFHAPFIDLRPGALDPKIRQVAKDRLQQVFDLVSYFHPLTVVCHPSFDERYYASHHQAWLENSIETWSHFLPLAEETKTIIALENVYETDPAPLTKLLGALSSPRIRFCFDTGHCNFFSRATFTTWIQEMGPYLVQLHIHDNSGSADDHAPVGEGNFPFNALFALLRERDLSPLVTLEPHALDDLWKTLKNIEMMDLPSRTNDNGNRNS
jgi:sugar phosphate isomerase/epimerase